MSVPDARSVPEGASRDRIRRIVRERQLVGLANDTKWTELLTRMRQHDGGRPPFRCKCIDSSQVTRWDSEWIYHPPMPLLVIEWLDVRLVRVERVGRLVPDRVVERFPWVVPALVRIGFDMEVRSDVVRIFGYAPRDLTGLEVR